LLDADPFVVRLLHYGLADAALFTERDVRAALAAVGGGQIDAQQPGPPVLQWFHKLQKQYEIMDTPSHLLSAASKLQFVDTFDSLEDLGGGRPVAVGRDRT
jgi:hypothetical protein